MKKMMFDESKVPYKNDCCNYSVTYYVYKDDKDHVEHSEKKDITENKKYIKNNNNACFSQLSSMLSAFSKKYKEWPNRLLFLCNFNKYHTKKYHLTKEEKYWWVDICKKYKLLPDYIDNVFPETGNLTLGIDGLDLNTIYVYLTIARHLQEEPYFVRAIKYLVTDKDMDFYVAFSVASRCCICNKGHHVIPVGKIYPSGSPNNDINNIDSYDFRTMIGLKKFLSGKIKSLIKDVKLGDSVGCFNLHKTLKTIETKTIKVTRNNLLSIDTIEKFYNT